MYKRQGFSSEQGSAHFKKPDASHIKQIKVVSNTHWDREFRRSFEKTRRRLLTMLDVTLEMRPEKRASVERLIQSGRLIISPY